MSRANLNWTYDSIRHAEKGEMMIRQKTLDKRIAKVMEMTEQLRQAAKLEENPDRVLILIGNHQIMVQHVLMGHTPTIW